MSRARMKARKCRKALDKIRRSDDPMTATEVLLRHEAFGWEARKYQKKDRKAWLEMFEYMFGKKIAKEVIKKGIL